MAEAVDWNGLGQEAIGEIIEWTKGAKDFVTEQAPLLVQEVLAWGFWYYFIWAAFCATAILVGMFGIYSIMRCYFTKPAESRDGDFLGATAVVSAATLVPLVFFCLNLIWMLKIVIAPRMYLLEYLSKLVK